MTARLLYTVAALGAAALLALGGSAAVAAKPAKPVKLADATLIVEVNATDGDAGLQVFLDGEPWRSMTITAPNGREIVSVNATGRLKGYGLTELFSESSEPPFDTFPLVKFKALFPEGRYTFRGETIEGKKLSGATRLSHDIPAGPKITSPRDGAVVDRSGTVASWAGVESAAGYRAIVTREDPLRIFSVDLTASARKVTIPSQFLEAGTKYKLEVQAIAKSGNQTLTEVSFRSRG